MTRGALLMGAVTVLAAGIVSPAMARPQYLMNFKANYKTATGKPVLNAANCSMCHVGMPRDAKFNPWGEAVGAALGAKNVTDAPKIIAAFGVAEKKMNPASKKTYLAHIQADSLPASTTLTVTTGAPTGTPIGYGTWDAAFNGVNMDGLSVVNGGAWKVEDGILKYTGGGNGWLKVNKGYNNYSLVIVWRFTQAGPNDSGIFLKAKPGDAGKPYPSSPQLNMGPGDDYGSIGGTTGSRKRFDLIKPMDWNTYQITVDHGFATLAINNQVAWDMATSDALKGMGNIGIEVEGRAIEFKQIWVMALPD